MARGLRRHGYYEVVYVPQVLEYDGRFRGRDQVTRGGTRSRPATATSPRSRRRGADPALRVPLLRRSRPRSRGATSRSRRHVPFGSGAEGRDVTVVAEVPACVQVHARDEQALRTHFALLARAGARRASGQRVVEDYLFQGPEDAVVEQGNVVFKRQLVLPGPVRVDVVAQDRDTGRRASTRNRWRRRLGAGIALSSVVVIRAWRRRAPRIGAPWILQVERRVSSPASTT